jgi:hypothetical protein
MYESYFQWLESHPEPNTEDPKDRQRWTKWMAWDYNREKRCPYVKNYWVHSGGDSYYTKYDTWYKDNRKYWDKYYSQPNIKKLSKSTLYFFEYIIKYQYNPNLELVAFIYKENQKRYEKVSLDKKDHGRMCYGWSIYNVKCWNKKDRHVNSKTIGLSKETLLYFDHICKNGFEPTQITDKEKEEIKKYMETAVKNYKAAQKLSTP